MDLTVIFHKSKNTNNDHNNGENNICTMKQPSLGIGDVLGQRFSLKRVAHTQGSDESQSQEIWELGPVPQKLPQR